MIDRGEWANLLREIARRSGRPPFTEEEMDAAFDAADADGNGALDLHEWIAAQKLALLSDGLAPPPLGPAGAGGPGGSNVGPGGRDAAAVAVANGASSGACSAMGAETHETDLAGGGVDGGHA